MAMRLAEREALLARWIQPSSDDEKDQQERAERMVTEAIRQHPAFRGVDLIVFAKGSYPNNTNVRRDSDVDIAVENHECVYYDVDSDAHHTSAGTYEGPWTREKWRSEVTQAIVSAFGASNVRRGKIALNVSAVAGSRPSIDVVPSFDYYWYRRAETHRGSCVWTSDGNRIVNWPDQQYKNGIAKNNATTRRYKQLVRALKNMENVLYESGEIEPLPSYLMECLIFNVPNPTLTAGSLDYACQETLRFLYHGLHSDDCQDWVEPNWLKWLFRDGQSWSPRQAKQLVLEAWNMLGYE